MNVAGGIAPTDDVAVAGWRRSRTRHRGVAALEWAQRNSVAFGLLVLLILFTVLNDRFLTRSNLTVILLQVAVVGIIAVPGAMLVLTGNVDLSVGSVVVLTSIVFGQVMSSTDNLPLSITVSLLVALVWGAVTGLFVSVSGMSPIIVTLGGLAGARGVAQLLSEGQTENRFGRAFGKLGNGRLLDTPVPVWILLGVVVVGAWAWHGTRLGRHMTAIGADATSARSLGVATRKIPFALYTASGLMAGIGGLITTSQLDGASLSIGRGLELKVLTAILLGGIAFTGGRGNLAGVVFGLLFMGVLSNGLVLTNVSPFWNDAVIGVALVAAAAFEVAYRRLERIAGSQAAAEAEG